MLPGEEKRYDATVNYTYTVDGQRYASQQVTLGLFDGDSNRRPAQAIVGRFSEGDEVTVHYDPTDPNSTYLVAQYSFFPAYPALALALLLLADLFTPSNHLVRYVLQRFDRPDRSRTGGTTPTTDGWEGDDGWDDPDSLDLSDETDSDAPADDSSDTVGSTGPLPTFEELTAAGVWVVAGLLSLAVVGHYLLTVRLPPHPFASLTAVGVVAVVAVLVG